VPIAPRSPRVGTCARGSTTGRPIMVALDLLGRRNALRILWELRSGPGVFRELQARVDTNPALLNTRLRELRGAAFVDRGEGAYQLTLNGLKLLEAMAPFYEWANKWGRSIDVS
jgi:DNA-binding HxlR family transcriptional regulator